MFEQMFEVDSRIKVLLRDLGVRPGDVLRRAGLPGDLFVRPSASLRPNDYFGLWNAVNDLRGDVALPVLIAQALSPETFNPPIFAALAMRRRRRWCGRSIPRTRIRAKCSTPLWTETQSLAVGRESAVRCLGRSVAPRRRRGPGFWVGDTERLAAWSFASSVVEIAGSRVGLRSSLGRRSVRFGSG